RRRKRSTSSAPPPTSVMLGRSDHRSLYSGRDRGPLQHASLCKPPTVVVDGPAATAFQQPCKSNASKCRFTHDGEQEPHVMRHQGFGAELTSAAAQATVTILMAFAATGCEPSIPRHVEPKGTGVVHREALLRTIITTAAVVVLSRQRRLPRQPSARGG